ncbi:hypothetical protein ACTHO0_25585 [Cytobacillus praedii]|uniref:hypothetical protein n=1 Tax=Cytobacillus TaxID=2675230 RepID=UPI00207AC0E6|nr:MULTISPECIES: hypothetical protein [Cytobacillus]MED3553945.1 hypothetical protein [Cytobacillus praedii]MED3574210.1 hypothetical protein [Cytobacillus praedii]MED3575503.1 hypothetical protein [Cytobacillus praedii]USK57713.1 hypothetical protein LIS82_27435 [Cytobacillus solani]
MLEQGVKRFILRSPSSFKIIGLMVGMLQVNLLDGEENFSMNMLLGNKEAPVDISPFLENVKIVS